MSGHEPWWKICENPFVRGLARLFTLFGVPSMLAFMWWYAATFDQMRQDILTLKLDMKVATTATIPSIQGEMRRVDRDHERRLRRLEAGDRRI